MPGAMSTAQSTPAKTRKEKERERREKAAQQQSNERLKTVVRRLPPNLPEDTFWQTVTPWVTEETASWKVYYAGKFKKRENKENIPSRAYIAFKNDEVLAKFSHDFDGHLFKDKAGNESYAIVEFAPYQKVPSEKRKPDNKNATIEKDDDYISFIESLNAPTSSEPVTIDSLLAATRPPSPPKTTPLLEALKAEKSAQKDKEAILRNHAHYKDPASAIAAGANGPPLSRKEEKKRAAVAQAQAIPPQAAKQQPTPQQPAATSSKKAKKQAKEAAAQAQKAGPAPKGANPMVAAPSEGKGANVNPTPAQISKQARLQAKQQAKAEAMKQAAAAAAAAAPAPQITIAARPPPHAAPQVTPPNAPQATPANGAASTAPSPRRIRPVISGRQFEAAMAGVGGSARPKREKGPAPAAQPINAPVQPNSIPQGHTAPAPSGPPSPAKSRGARHGRGGGPPPVHALTAGPSVPVVANPGPVVNGKAPPMILQRNPSAARSPQATPGVIVPPHVVPPVVPPVEHGRGRGGGRGRGRGRGGPPRGGARGG
ncbi:hypothetical protein FA15DRAFT_357273 [Coprinopsis marcescibilis]|uniref:UPF3 domain-containing protein n=1 Tax=Coprinopsis marcescibilis TaxID=230819 RepID=A0A5C3KYQ3_COPMA|nr:hypothetical protein FA15DRAFT_357273 [Coprinopsis marcescibilis]